MSWGFGVLDGENASWHVEFTFKWYPTVAGEQTNCSYTAGALNVTTTKHWCETNWWTVDPDTVKVCDYSHKSGDSGKHPVLGGRSRADEHYYTFQKKRSGEKDRK
jgi:hypothetical protein